MKRLYIFVLMVMLFGSFSACMGKDQALSEYHTQSNIQDMKENQTEVTQPGQTETKQPEHTEPKKPEQPETTQSVQTNPTQSEQTEATQPVHRHTYVNATCTMPKRCSCGTTEGYALGHNWIEATCTAAKTCAVCGEIEGTALNHTYVDFVCSCGDKAYLDPRTVDLRGTQFYGKYQDVHHGYLLIPSLWFDYDFSEMDHIEVGYGNEIYRTGPITDGEPLHRREYLYYTVHNEQRYDYHYSVIMTQYHYQLTEKEILIYSSEQGVEQPEMRFMVLKDGSLVWTGGTSLDQGRMDKERDTFCGLDIIKEKNKDYNPNVEENS